MQSNTGSEWVVRRLLKPIVTTGYIGYLKVAPGTFASAVAALVAWWTRDTMSLVAVSIIMLVLGLALCKSATEVLASKDPRPFVLDEWCGMSIALIHVPMNVVPFLAAFFLFRLFDIWKPLGIRNLDRWDHPWSIMLDDVLAGLYANLCVQIFLKWIPALNF